jgi:hypothetical protein
MPAMRPSGIFETVLYAEDLGAAERFYRDAVGLEVIGRGDLAVVVEKWIGKKAVVPSTFVTQPVMLSSWLLPYCGVAAVRSFGAEGVL